MTDKGVKEIWISPIESSTEWCVEIHFYNVQEWPSYHHSKQEVEAFLRNITEVLPSFPMEQAENCLLAWAEHLKTCNGEFLWTLTP
jgi:hypothetical protein